MEEEKLIEFAKECVTKKSGGSSDIMCQLSELVLRLKAKTTEQACEIEKLKKQNAMFRSKTKKLGNECGTLRRENRIYADTIEDFWEH